MLSQCLERLATEQFVSKDTRSCWYHQRLERCSNITRSLFGPLEKGLFSGDISSNTCWWMPSKTIGCFPQLTILRMNRWKLLNKSFTNTWHPKTLNKLSTQITVFSITCFLDSFNARFVKWILHPLYSPSILPVLFCHILQCSCFAVPYGTTTDNITTLLDFIFSSIFAIPCVQ